MKRIFFFLVAVMVSIQASARVRKVVVSGDQIVAVKTAIGIATIIQVPDRPNSVVVGDQDSFKVEYLDQAITIKPLHPGAKSNLYVYTDWKRYNVQLITGSESQADYVVYLETPKSVNKKLTTNSWRIFSNKLKNDDLNLQTHRVGVLKDNSVAIEFTVSSPSKLKFEPSWIWITQNGKTTPIHNLIISNLDLGPQSKVNGVLQILKSDLDTNEPLRLEMRRKKQSYLTIPKVDTWKQLKGTL